MEEFYLKKKIYYHDTDCGGVVYYANYLKYMEEGRTELFSQRGIDLKGLMREGVVFVVGSIEVKYRSPAYYQDEISVVTRIEKIKTASIEFYQKIMRKDTLLCEGRTTLVCVSSDLRPRSVPATLKSSLSS